jgi:hypothetical protein
MRPLPLLLSIAFCCLFSTASISQPSVGVSTFFAAQAFDDYSGAERVNRVQILEKNQWYVQDSMYAWADNDPSKTVLQVEKHLLAPYLDDNGYIVYWVPEVAPQFPGGKDALDLYKKDVLGELLSMPGDDVQRSIYIRCTIDSGGNVTDVAEAQTHAEWIPKELISRCLEAVRYMPAWSPGQFRGKAVCTYRLIGFDLKS